MCSHSCMHVCVFAFMYACLCVRMCVCMLWNLHVRLHTKDVFVCDLTLWTVLVILNPFLLLMLSWSHVGLLFVLVPPTRMRSPPHCSKTFVMGLFLTHAAPLTPRRKRAGLGTTAREAGASMDKKSSLIESSRLPARSLVNTLTGGIGSRPLQKKPFPTIHGVITEAERQLCDPLQPLLGICSASSLSLVLVWAVHCRCS